MIVLRLLALFDPAIKGVLPLVGRIPQMSNARAKADMGMQFTSPVDALTASADWLLAQGEV